jgi:ubiquinone/menaquinone biosynthesis C-methylase UbiE
MNKIITVDDFKDVFIKAGQRGWPFILSKLNFSGTQRTKSAFGKTAGLGVNWWQVPYVQKRWNKMITGEEDKSYLSYLTNDFLKEKDISLISFGSGNCMTEIELAKTSIFSKIVCVELSETRTMRAKEIIKKQNLKNITIKCESIYDYNFSKSTFDIAFFKSSLHHFKNIDSLLKDKISYCLKHDGYLIIDECVAPNRLQYSKYQLRAINKTLKTVPKKFRKISGLNIYKNKVYGPGIVRMILADPSECVESSKILPLINKYFNPVIEKPYGGNILASVLKDIAHHFNELDEEKKEILDTLFKLEDKYLETNPSDFIFGIYTIKNSV